MWTDGVGQLEASDVFFGESWNEDLSLKGCVHVPIPFTDGIGFGGGVGIRTSGAIEMGYKAELNGGTLDVHLPMEVEWRILDTTGKPPAIGSTVRVSPRWHADPAARLTSCVQPDFNAGLTAGVQFALAIDISLKFIVNILDVVLLDTGSTWPASYAPFTNTLDYVPYLNVRDILEQFGFPQTGEWFTASDSQGFFEIGMRTPKLVAEGGFVPVLSGDGLTSVSGAFNSSAEDRFLKMTAYVSEIIHAIADTISPYPLPPISAELSQGGSVNFSVAYRVLQLLALCDMGARQGLQVDVEPRVRYVLSTGEQFDRALEEPFEFQLNTESVTITPHVYAQMTFHNDTDVLIIPGVGWETFGIAASASVEGKNLFSIDECFFCYETDIATIPLSVFNNQWMYTTPEVEEAPILVRAEGTLRSSTWAPMKSSRPSTPPAPPTSMATAPSTSPISTNSLTTGATPDHPPATSTSAAQ